MRDLLMTECFVLSFQVSPALHKVTLPLSLNIGGEENSLEEKSLLVRPGSGPLLGCSDVLLGVADYDQAHRLRLYSEVNDCCAT